MKNSFSYSGAKKIVFGSGSSAALAQHLGDLKARRPLVVLDKNLAADGKLIKIFNNTKITTKTGKIIDFTKLKEGQTIDMMQMASVVSANID